MEGDWQVPGSGQHKRPTFEELTAAQSVTGFWPEKSKGLLDRFAEKGNAYQFDTGKIEIATKGKAAKGDITATLVALYILSEFFEEKEDEWTLLTRKAKTWLKEQGIENPKTLIDDIHF